MAEIRKLGDFQASKSSDIVEDPTIDRDDLVLTQIKNLKTESKEDRDQFTQDWRDIENQIKGIPPDEWGTKEDWQTKLYLPFQAKAYEAGSAIMQSMLYGQGRWFGITGIGPEDKEKETELARFLDVIFEQGKFDIHNGYVLDQSVSIGTSYNKILKDPNGPRIIFSFRNTKRVFQDPASIVDFEDSRYWMEQYNENVFTIQADPSISNNKKNELLMHLHGKSEGKEGDHIQAFSSDGETIYQISQEYQEVELIEFWGLLPVHRHKKIKGKMIPYVKVESRYVVLADDAIILRNEPNPYGFIPVTRSRFKRKPDHAYGNGFLLNGKDLQNLANTVVNLGMDSAKIAYLPLRVYEEGAIADASSLELRPLGEIALNKGMSGAFRIERFDVNATSNLIADLTTIDQQHQEASGINRVSQGADIIEGQDETLGQTQLKLASAERRMLKFAKENTEDYILPVLRKVYAIITNEEWIDEFQELANQILGFDDIVLKDPQTGQEQTFPADEEVILQDPVTGQQIPVPKQPKLNLRELGKLDIDFKPLGLANFVQKTEKLKKMNDFLRIIIASPQLQALSRLDKVFKATMDMADIEDSENFLKSEEEMAQLEQQLSQLVGAPVSAEELGVLQAAQGGGGNPGLPNA